MKRLIIKLSILFFTQLVFAQSDTSLVEIESIDKIQQPYLFAEVDAEPIVGMNVWYNILSKYCQVNYPEIDRKNGVEGKVFVSFVIEKDGSISDLSILKGVSSTIDKVAMDAVIAGGKWKPAKQGGREVRMMKRLPIKFSDGGSKESVYTPKEVPVAKIGDMELMSFIHKKSKSYSIKKKIKGEEAVYIRVVFDDKGFQKETLVIRSTNKKLNKIALKYVKSYKEGWILPIGDNTERESIVLPVLFSVKLNIDNL